MRQAGEAKDLNESTLDIVRSVEILQASSSDALRMTSFSKRVCEHPIHSGTETDSTISRRTDSVVSDFFCREAWRELATTRCAKTGTASSLKSSGKQQTPASR